MMYIIVCSSHGLRTFSFGGYRGPQNAIILQVRPCISRATESMEPTT